jgi:ABC-2 type transport system ATP-binding protein
VVESDGTRDVREEIAARAVREGWGLLELRSLTLSLEDIFIRIIRGESA